MRFRRGLWLGAVALAAVAGVVVAAVGFAGGANAASGRQAYLQVNTCGNSCNRGGLAVVRNLAGTIAAHQPYAVTLNEMCENQYDRLRAQLRGYAGRFDPTGPTCRNGARYGNAILVRSSTVDLVRSWPLPNPSGHETRRLMCLRTPSFLVCVTHISYLPADIAAQVATVARILRGLGDVPVLLGGDFNTGPADPRMSPLYGAFAEAGSQATMGARKIDYLFRSAGHWADARDRVIDAARGLSDHRSLLATAVFRGWPASATGSAAR
jgi:endonuclease/exonuclease/phosphatase family metal-dependent hydrolase